MHRVCAYPLPDIRRISAKRTPQTGTTGRSKHVASSTASEDPRVAQTGSSVKNPQHEMRYMVLQTTRWNALLKLCWSFEGGRRIAPNTAMVCDHESDPYICTNMGGATRPKLGLGRVSTQPEHGTDAFNRRGYKRQRAQSSTQQDKSLPRRMKKRRHRACE